MHHFIKLILMGVVVSMLGSCGPTAPAIGTVIPVTPITQLDDRHISMDDDFYAIPGGNLGLMVAGTPEQQAAMLATIPRDWKPNVATAAITDTLLIGVFTGVRWTNGYQVVIDTIGLNGAVVTVQVTYTTPKPNQLLQQAGPRSSFAVVGIDRALLPMATNLTVRVVDQTNAEMATQTYQMP